MNNFDDVPIEKPDQDRLGLDPFARAISDCLQGIKKPRGSVVAIYGPWGSGKSSAINLVRYHLSKAAPDLNVINFPAWMYHTEEALTVGFFRELHAGLSSRLSKEWRKKAIKALQGLRVILAGVSTATGWASVGWIITVLKFIPSPKPVDDLQATLADALCKAKKKFLVVIDDLDRLSPEEALAIFRLVKSVGRLPNVMYLLAYDRERMEQAVAERFPSEGAHYLEKIVQAGFELPRANQLVLNQMMADILDGLVSEEPDDVRTEFGNFFHAIVAPELKTPRDVFRLANMLEITIAPVKSDVFLPDFVGIETLRVFRPAVYRAIRQNKFAILNADQSGGHDQPEARSEEYTTMLLSGEPEADHQQLRDALMRLFPQLEKVFVNASRSWTRDWKRQRRVCSPEHFDTYFRFSVSPETISKADLDYFLDASRTVKKIQDRILEALKPTRVNVRTKASYILDELAAHGPDISLGHGERLLTALFGIADKLFVKQDNFGPGPGWGNNLRLNDLLRLILLDRTDLDVRSGILARAMKNAPLQWHVDFSKSAWEDHHPSDSDREPSPEAETLTTERVAEQLQERSLEMLRDAAAKDGTLLSAPRPANLLFGWDRLKPDGSDEVTQFTSRVMKGETGLCQLADAFLGKSYSQGMGVYGVPGDLVQRESDRAQIEGIEQLLDVEEFRQRLNEALQGGNLDENQKSTVGRFLAAWERQDAGQD